MNAVCELNHFAKPKFDELGRQYSLDRLQVVGSKFEAPFEQIVDLVKATLNAPICAVSLIDNDRQWFKAIRGLNVEHTPRKIAFCDHTIRADKPLIIEDATLDQRFKDNPLVTGEPFIRAYLGIPLKMPDGYIVGSLCIIYQKPRSFTAHDIVILESFANLVVGELELRTIAFTDSLTNLLSRKAWKDRVKAAIERAVRHSTPLCILLLDLDHFKQVNDTYGHDIGDLVLRKTAEAIGSVLREHDISGRLGGEEFAVCLVNANKEDGLAVAERIRALLYGLRIPAFDSLRCSTSIGVAVFETGKNVDDLLKMADLALYEAKRRGRNKVELVMSLTQEPSSLALRQHVRSLISAT